MACAGLDPSFFQTGEFVAAEARLAKRGSPSLRRALWLAAGLARLYNRDLQAVDEREIARGKHHNEAIAALCHLLLNRVHIVLK